MPTRQGWLLLVGSAMMVLAGRLFGIFELYVLGAGGGALVAASTVAVATVSLRVDVVRSLHPARVHAGTPTRVELTVRNRRGRTTPTLELRDPVGTGRAARMVVPPIAASATTTAAYRLPTERRGIVPVGPLQVTASDPFGVAAARVTGAPAADLTVYPAVEDVVPLPLTHGDDPHAGADHPNAIALGGEDFYALREYVQGDDLRRVHWPATARHDELMIRQEELPWQGRATVLLDTRTAAHEHADGFEQAVSAAASVVLASWRRRYLLRLVTTGGYDSGFAAGAAHVEEILEHLAVVATSDGGDLPGVVATLRRSGSGALVTVTGDADRGDAHRLASLRTRFGTVVTVRCGAPDGGPAVTGDRRTPVVTVPRGEPVAPRWNAAMAKVARTRPAGVRPAAPAAGTSGP